MDSSNPGLGFHGLTDATLDDIDQQIVACLQKDGRMSISAISRTIGLSHAGTSQRLQRLFSSRIVAIGAITNPTTHGFHRRAALLIKTAADARRVAERIAEFPETYYVVIVTGRLDVLVEFIARDDAHFEEMTRRIRGVEGVIDTEAIPFLDIIKWEYSPGFPKG